MLMRFLLLIFLLPLFSGCAKHRIITLPVTRSAEQIRTMPTFNRVKVSGIINVNLHTGYGKPQVILQGDPRDLLNVVTAVNAGTLSISFTNGCPCYGAVFADIRSRYLNAFTFKGIGTVKAVNIQSGLLDLDIDNAGKTIIGGSVQIKKLRVAGTGYTQISGVNTPYLNLELVGKTRAQVAGVINLASIDLDDGSWLSMYWVKSRHLRIHETGTAYLQLAGAVDKLEVDLWELSRFNGRYLRANRAFVKTHDKSVAEFSAVSHQHTLATDDSNIYFYNIPTTRADFMAYLGSVLDMREWSPYGYQDYVAYNK